MSTDSELAGLLEGVMVFSNVINGSERSRSPVTTSVQAARVREEQVAVDEWVAGVQGNLVPHEEFRAVVQRECL
eukprot:3661971-Rhodomonas_salina.1